MKSNDFDSLIDLIEYVKNDIAKVSNTTMKNEIKKVIQEKTQEVVYDAYDPIYYDRRYYNGGLIDDRNINVSTTVIGDEIRIDVENTTKVSDKSYDSNGNAFLDEIIENGYGNKKTEYNKPRRFMKESEKEIYRSKLIENILKQEIDYIY